MTNYTFFLQGSDRWGKDLTLVCGAPQHLPLLTAIPYSTGNPVRPLLPHQPQGRGDKEKFQNDITFLLVSAKEEATGDRKYGLSTIWANPCQVRVSSMEEVVRKLTAWVSSGPNWPYALVHLNKDTCHVPLPKEGHLGILPQGGTNMTTCRRISQLEVCLLLTSGLQVTYPVGLNGQEDPIITSLPGSLANSISLTGGGSINLELFIPQPMVEEPDWKASPLGRCSSILIASPLRTTPPKLEGDFGMTMEVWSLLSRAMLDTSGHGSGTLTPKRPNPMVILTSPPHKLRDFSRLVDTLSQVSAPNDVKMAEVSL